MSFPELSPLFSSTSTNLGGGRVEDIRFWIPPHLLEFFFFFYFSYPWKIQAQQSPSPTPTEPKPKPKQNCERPLEIPHAISLTPGNSISSASHRPSYLDFFPISPPLAAWKFHFLKLTTPCPVWLFSGIAHQRSKIKTWEILQLFL